MKKIIFAIFIISMVFLTACGSETIGNSTKFIESIDGKNVEGCIDSDEGINEFEEGFVQINGQTYEDECFAGFLIEYYCENNEVKNKNFRCNCKSGKCTE